MKKINFKNLNFYKNKKIIITGNTGFKGAWLTMWLLSLGAKIVGISKDIPTKPSLFINANLNKKMKTFFIDVSNLKKFSKVVNDFKPDIIFHLAAQSIVSKSFENPMETYLSNSIGTANLLEILRKYKKKLSAVIITSDKCYYPTKNGYYTETSKLGGFDPYSGSKAISELFFQNYYESFLFKKKNIKVVTARAGNVIGGGDWTKDRILPDLFRSIINKEKFTIRNPNANRPWQHVLEPLAAYLFLARAIHLNFNKMNGHSYNIGPNLKNNLSVIQLIKKIESMWPKIEINYIIKNNKKFKESKKLNLNTIKIKKDLNWKNKLKLNQICIFVVEWYKNYLLNKKNIYSFSLSQITKYSNLK